MKKSINNTTGQRSTYSVIFYLKKTVRKKNGLCPVMGRITIDGESRAFSLKVDADANRMTGKSRQAIAINREIEKYRKKIDGCYHEILYSQGYITAETVKNALEGRGQRESGLMQLYREHNEEFRLRVGVDMAKATYKRYRLSYNRLLEFLQHKYQTDEIALQHLTFSFIEEYDFHLRHTRNMRVFV
jgi:hypothetical protein